MISQHNTTNKTQAFVDVHDAFGGFAAEFLQEVRDEYGKKSVLTFTLTPPTDHVAAPPAYRAINTAMAMVSASDLLVLLSLS